MKLALLMGGAETPLPCSCTVTLWTCWADAQESICAEPLAGGPCGHASRPCQKP